ncbi:MAG TPA: tRNA guanosine(15) transglycosylase TgtA [Thermoplasmata archaeon]|nr:tRNA guanosine(15) transglycosylase TgtA [Thermoplasmata archaeon]
MFEVRERDGLGRIGVLETAHGRVATPTLAPVVNPNRPIIPPGDLATRFGAQILITNAYILGKSPGRDAIVRDGIHRFLGFPGPVMTDSGAFQSHVYGDVDVTNAEVMAFQKAIHADFGTMLDVFSEPGHDHSRAAKDVDETLRRAQEAVSLRGDMALVGAVQGGLHADLRERCARSVSSLDVAVCAIGGVVPLLEAYRFRDLVRVIIASKKGLDPSKPVHLFGAGHPLVFPLAALLGCDLFDSASYAKYARDGRMLFPDGTRRASDVRESGCLCPVCTAHPMEKIAAEEILLAEHNLHACFGAIREVRQAIAEGDLWGLAERRARSHPALLDAVRELRRHNEFLEEFEPVSRQGALYYVGPETAHRPILHRLRRRLAERYRAPPAKGLLVFPEGGRPFSERLAHIVDQALQVADVHMAVKSVWGPVPLELDHVWPMCQTVVPEVLDLEALEAAEVFFREWAAGAGFSFGLLWEGETTLDELRTRAPGARTVDWSALRIRATADLQFGRGAADALLNGTVSYVISKNTGKIRNVHVNGEHVLSLRAEDGWFTLKAAGARRLSNAFPAPKLRIVVEDDAVPFHRKGKNVFAKFVRDADPEIRPGDEALVVSADDELCAVAQATMNRREMLAFKRGVAAHVREGVPPAPSAPRR